MAEWWVLGDVRIWEGLFMLDTGDSRRGVKVGICGIAGGWGLLGSSGRIEIVWARGYGIPSAIGWGRAG